MLGNNYLFVAVIFYHAMLNNAFLSAAPCTLDRTASFMNGSAVVAIAESQSWWVVALDPPAVMFGRIGDDSAIGQLVIHGNGTFARALAVRGSLLYVGDPGGYNVFMWRYDLSVCIGQSNCLLDFVAEIAVPITDRDPVMEYGHALVATRDFVAIACPGAVYNGLANVGTVLCQDHNSGEVLVRAVFPITEANARLGSSLAMAEYNGKTWRVAGAPGYRNSAGAVAVDLHLNTSEISCQAFRTSGTTTILTYAGLYEFGYSVATDAQYVIVTDRYATKLLVYSTVDLIRFESASQPFSIISSQTATTTFLPTIVMANGCAAVAAINASVNYAIYCSCDAFTAPRGTVTPPAGFTFINVSADYASGFSAVAVNATGYGMLLSLDCVNSRNCSLPAVVPVAAIVAPIVCFVALVMFGVFARVVLWPKIALLLRENTFKAADPTLSPAPAAIPMQVLKSPMSAAAVWSDSIMNSGVPHESEAASTNSRVTNEHSPVSAASGPADRRVSVPSVPGCRVARWSDLVVTDFLGRGAFGEVHKAELWGTTVAVKTLLKKDDKLLADFEREVAMISTIRHPNIVLFLAVCLDKLAIITEFVDNGSLLEIISKRPDELTRERAWHIALDVARALNYLHEQTPPVIHRDLKSPNILLTKTWEPKIADFGLSTIKKTDMVDTVVGSPVWMAPEVACGSGYTATADVYSWGVVLWELVCKKLPFSGMLPMQILAAKLGAFQLPLLWESMPDDTPPDVVDLVQRCLNDDPTQRPTLREIIVRMQILTGQKPTPIGTPIGTPLGTPMSTPLSPLPRVKADPRASLTSSGSDLPLDDSGSKASKERSGGTGGGSGGAVHFVALTPDDLILQLQLQSLEPHDADGTDIV
eukprot:TRINITY_DN2509_c0_g3_i1.p1 TRINITY_DN2509_c0_g3~~TRINITY_DN2509_c0_g3_i1.p1  ORF type:complete len:873 (-),score=145.63 TRINITY_DN2509_c0_g3_i1:820-3438(-)